MIDLMNDKLKQENIKDLQKRPLKHDSKIGIVVPEQNEISTCSVMSENKLEPKMRLTSMMYSYNIKFYEENYGLIFINYRFIFINCRQTKREK